jgi:CheY-like chemotaxis protein
LIADRNRHVRDFLRRELTAEGYQVEMAADGREVLSRIEGADPPHLLILDLEIPYLDEPEVVGPVEGLPAAPAGGDPPFCPLSHQPDVALAAAFLEKKVKRIF